MTDLYCGLAEIAVAYAVSPRTAGKLLRSGQIPGKRVGNKWIVSKASRYRQLDAGAYQDARAAGTLERFSIEVVPGKFMVFEGCAVGPIMSKAEGMQLMGDTPVIKAADGSIIPASWVQ